MGQRLLRIEIVPEGLRRQVKTQGAKNGNDTLLTSSEERQTFRDAPEANGAKHNVF